MKAAVFGAAGLAVVLTGCGSSGASAPVATAMPTARAAPPTAPPKPGPPLRSTASPQYSANIDGTIPIPETVGQVVDMKLTVVNTGAAMRHLVLDFDGLGSWGVNAVKGCHGTGIPVQGPGNPYDFGPLDRSQSCALDLTLAAKDAGTHTLSFTTYCDVNASGIVSTSCAVNNSGANGTWDVAINP
jgi:hypothetical protein